MNRYLEDFFKDILNIVYGYKLKNLNEDRSNNPGLDLGDEGAKVAFQVTSTKTSDKINETLKKAAGQASKFPNIYGPDPSRQTGKLERHKRRLGKAVRL